MSHSGLPKTFPAIVDYDMAVGNLDKFASSKLLKTGVPEKKKAAQGGSSNMICYAGGVAVAYPIKCGSYKYALKLWTAHPGDGASNYDQLISHLRKQAPASGAVVVPQFESRGILVRGQWYPTLLLEWMEGDSAQKFIEKHLGDPPTILAVAEAFLAVSDELKTAQIAHGDLQGENIKIVMQFARPRVRLIDYDTMLVPGLEGRPIPNDGIPHYQHPKRRGSLGAEQHHCDDHFAALVIYLSLKAVAEDPSLWAQFPPQGRDKELLFTEQDFAATKPSAIFRRLYGMSPVVSALSLILWNFTRSPSHQGLPSLAECLRLASPQPPTQAPPPVGTNSSFDSWLASQRPSPAAPSSGSGSRWMDDSGFRGAGPIHTASVPPLSPPTPPGRATDTFWSRYQAPGQQSPPPPPSTAPTPAPAPVTSPSFATFLNQHGVPYTPSSSTPPTPPPPVPTPQPPPINTPTTSSGTTNDDALSAGCWFGVLALVVLAVIMLIKSCSG